MQCFSVTHWYVYLEGEMIWLLKKRRSRQSPLVPKCHGTTAAPSATARSLVCPRWEPTQTTQCTACARLTTTRANRPSCTTQARHSVAHEFSQRPRRAFDADPIGMSAVNDTFPRAGADGSSSYEKTVSFKALGAAFTKKFPGQQLDFDRRVVFLHAIPASTKLPATVASLVHIPAQVV